jgi:hypothetical protein
MSSSYQLTDHLHFALFNLCYTLGNIVICEENIRDVHDDYKNLLGPL